MMDFGMLSKMAPTLMKQQLSKLPKEQRKIFQDLEIGCHKKETEITIRIKYVGDDKKGPQAAKNMTDTLAQQLPNMLSLFGTKVIIFKS